MLIFGYANDTITPDDCRGGNTIRLAILQKSQHWLADHIGMSTYSLSRRILIECEVCVTQ